MDSLWSKLQATASAAAEQAARASGAAYEHAQAAGSAAVEQAAVVRALAAEQVDRLSAMEVSELAAAAADTAERLAQRATRVGEQAAARAGALAADAAETLGELAHAERRAQLADRLRALLLSDEAAADDVAGERDTDPALGITPELVEFVATLQTLPPPHADALPLTRWQLAHSKAMLAKSPHLAQLRSTLCPATLSEQQFWAAYFDTCGDRLVPAAEAPTPSVVLLAPPTSPAPFTANDQAPRRDDDVHTLVVAADDAADATRAAAEAHAGDGDGALEDFLHAVLTPAGAASDAEDAGGDAALEAEFAALLRGESGSSISLESADEPETK